MAVYLYGASGHAKVIIEILEACNEQVGGLIDANPAITGLLGYPVSQELAPSLADDRLIITIGNNKIRQRLAGELHGYNFASTIHPSAQLSPRCSVGEGSVVMAGVSVNSGARIGSHVILNTNCSVDHECVLGDYVHISPGVALAGDVKVGEGTHVGIGACVIQGVSIGKWCTIGAGAVVIKDVPDGCTVVGNPARIIKTNKEQ